MNDDESGEESATQALTSDEVSAQIDTLLSSERWEGWVRNTEIDLGDKRWRPSAVSHDGQTLLYLSLQHEIPRHVVARLQLARKEGLQSVVALNLAALYEPAVLTVLVEADSELVVLDSTEPKHRVEPASLLSTLADHRVPLSPAHRSFVCGPALDRMAEGSSHEKGKRLEDLLALLFSQVVDLTVVERNYNTETEEIDLVLQVDNFSNRCWQQPGVPYLLVESKNRADKASQAMVTQLLGKLETKRGTVRIGIMVSLAGFTSSAEKHELRYSTTDKCVVMLDGAAIRRLVDADDLDETLESLVRAAQLR